jgi:hypothetical protein
MKLVFLGEITMKRPPRSFGVFAPVGYLVLAFQEEREAAHAREALLTGGYDDEEVMTFSSEQVISAFENTRDNISVLAYLGTELAHQREQFEYARQGCTFLVVYAPTEAEAARVLRVAWRYGARLAHKYNQFTVEEVLMGSLAARKTS